MANLVNTVSVIIYLFVLPCTVLGRQGYGPGEQEYGHIQVRENAKMFYWLFYVQDEQVTHFTERPLVIWLQGGPGVSSTGFGNFLEVGPMDINSTVRSSSWAKHVNIMFVDSPVGAGFSYVSDPSAYARTDSDVGADLVEFTKQFYTMFPEFLNTPLYVVGESYGGKVAVEFVKQLEVAINNENLPISLGGLGLGGPWLSPVQLALSMGTYLINLGIVDLHGQQTVQVEAQHIGQQMSHQNYAQATSLFINFTETVSRLTGNVDFDNILNRVPFSGGSLLSPRGILARTHLMRDTEETTALMEGPVREALGIAEDISFGGQSDEVFNALYEEFMKGGKLADVLNSGKTDVHIYNGQLDLIVCIPGTVETVQYMYWNGEAAWDNVTSRVPLVVDGVVEGYVKELSKLHFYWIDRAGHLVPKDNPAAGLEVLRRITKYNQLKNL